MKRDLMTLAREAAASTVEEDEGLQSGYRRGDYADSPRVAVAVLALKPVLAELARWDGLEDAIREMHGHERSWPSHGNAPLAIAAGYQLLKMKADQNENIEHVALMNGRKAELKVIRTAVEEMLEAAQESASGYPEGYGARIHFDSLAVAYQNVLDFLTRRA